MSNGDYRGGGGGGYGGGGRGRGGPGGRGQFKGRKRSKVRPKTKKKDPIFVDGVRPRPLFVDYKDIELLKKLINRHGKIVGRRKSGCTAVSQHAVTLAIKRARYMALLPYVGEKRFAHSKIQTCPQLGRFFCAPMRRLE